MSTGGRIVRALRRTRLAAQVVVFGLVVATAGCGRAPEPGGSAEARPPGEPAADPVVERPEPDSDHVAALAAGLNDVGYRIFEALATDSSDDLVLSPLSIGVAFGMADAGASGVTADALATLFAYPVQGEERLAAFNALEQQVSSEDGPLVRLANRQFPDVSFETAEGYDELLGRWFGAGIEPLPLRTDGDASRERINRWVEQRTEGLIPDLLPDGLLGPDSELVLVNALYLEADWALPFSKDATAPATFTRLDGSTVTVPLMRGLEVDGPAVATAEYAATELPYTGGELSMLIIVPETGSFEQVQARLTSGLVDEIDAATSSGGVELYLPRFESAADLNLRAVIEGALGATDLFGVTGFDGIAPGITLEGAVHAADIEVDEVGTVAAAATALDFDTGAPPEPEITVRADKPFLYLVRHQPTGAVLFVGRVLDPAA
jgi:serpin B